MSEPHEALRMDVRAVDTEQVDGGGRMWRAAVATIACGLVVGGLLGAGYGAVQPASYQATTALSVLPDSVVQSNPQSSLPVLDATSFIQGQLVLLNGGQLADDVARRLQLTATPNITATQVGQTYVVEVTGTASTSTQARRIATMTGVAYKDLRTQQLSREINASLRSTNAQLTTVQAALAKSNTPNTSNTAGGLTPAQTALQTEYERLLSLGSSLKLALPQVGTVVSVESQARLVPASLSPVVESGLLGMLGGAVLAMLGLLLYRRLVPRIRTVGDVADLGVPVLLPVLPRQTRRAAKSATAFRSNPARLIAGRVTSQNKHRVLVVVGATPKVGSSYAAASLAAAVAARGPVLLVQAVEPAFGATSLPTTATLDVHPSGPAGRSIERADGAKRVSPSTIPGVWLLPDGGDLIAAGASNYSARAKALLDVLRRAAEAGWFVVVDAAALSESDLALDCLTAADSVAALVVGRGVSRPADVLGAAELFEARASTFAGVILNDIPRRHSHRRRSGRRNTVALGTSQIADSSVGASHDEGGGRAASENASRRRHAPKPASYERNGGRGIAAGPADRVERDGGVDVNVDVLTVPTDART